MHIASIGIDLGKTSFHLVALGERNKVLLRKKFSRPQLLAYTANLPASLVGLEACAGAHFLGTALREQGHQVRLIPEQFVKPYRKSNKNDFIDAEAIAEAALHDGKHEILNAQSEHYVGPEMCGYLQYGQDCEDGNGSENQDLLLLEEVANGTPSHLVERHCGLCGLPIVRNHSNILKSWADGEVIVWKDSKRKLVVLT